MARGQGQEDGPRKVHEMHIEQGFSTLTHSVILLHVLQHTLVSFEASSISHLCMELLSTRCRDTHFSHWSTVGSGDFSCDLLPFCLCPVPVREVSKIQFEIRIGGDRGVDVSFLLYHADKSSYPDHQRKICAVVEQLKQWMTEDLLGERRERRSDLVDFELIVYVLSQELLERLLAMGVIQYNYADANVNWAELVLYLLQQRSRPDLNYAILAVILDGDDDGTTAMMENDAWSYVPPDIGKLVRVTYDRSSEPNIADLTEVKEYLASVQPIENGKLLYSIM